LFWVLPVKLPDIIRASCDAVAASDTAVIINKNNASFIGIGRTDGTNLFTGSVITHLARYREKIHL
jgi:hypothetical protein